MNKHRNTTKFKDTSRRYKYIHKYKISLDDYDAMMKVQGGVCKICGTDNPNGPGRFHVDRNHTTGKVRGLLCNKCNLGLGAFNDDINILAKSIQYLSREDS